MAASRNRRTLTIERPGGGGEGDDMHFVKKGLLDLNKWFTMNFSFF